MNNNEIDFKIIKELGILYENPNDDGWDKVVNIVSWGGKAPKLDIRSWNKDRTRMGKGVTLSKSELEEFIDMVKDIDF